MGGNLGDVLARLAWALGRMARAGWHVTAVSKAYRTRAVTLPGAPPGPDYWNAACKVRAPLTTLAMLRFCKSLEAASGRRSGGRWAPRPLDLDIILRGDEVHHSAELTVPHPAFAGRPFVLLPLCDVAPDFTPPGVGRRLRDVAGELADPREGILEVRSPAWAGPFSSTVAKFSGEPSAIAQPRVGTRVCAAAWGPSPEVFAFWQGDTS